MKKKQFSDNIFISPYLLDDDLPPKYDDIVVVKPSSTIHTVSVANSTVV